MAFSMGEKIRIVLRRKKLTITDLATAIGTSRQNLTNKLNRDNFSEKELQQIAEALGCRFEGYFIFEDGERV
ncbi:helix-turn-helix transcriptional regulator [Paramaledivibacter caminithermalis]|jgi:transcriptional regulator with XRE-family HTH domain|uniref:DNA-binding transcriptional regulator, XRE-family HTH domain n=1 Tax=Paramaledivibacter caminithermalis (strain DSM 15212 / CIP 107654 / DViRD3) TaxID=1121301 RepID=A0A1M6S9V8_PARC5|nr:helix-turn-helix transcriptional regulator [Paramaledivibacter caminithermalis]SHK41338.1 DNA-binding transcriptional regulator, XRE-family HTH domain [Paramaledivibacter caminithermalis DSM 15212]